MDKTDPHQPNGTLQPCAIRFGSFAVTRNPASPNKPGQSMLQSANIRESELLAKREKYLVFIKNTELTVKKWREASTALAPMLGLDTGDLTITQLKQLSRMAMLCFSEDKPEPQWFDAKYLEQVQETVGKAKQLYQEHNLLKSRLDQTYTDGIYNLTSTH